MAKPEENSHLSDSTEETKTGESILRKTFITLLVIMLIGTNCYAALWYYTARTIQAHANNTLANWAKKGIVFNGSHPDYNGFPFTPTTTLSGKFTVRKNLLSAQKPATISIPKLSITGFILPYTPIKIEMPEGLQLRSGKSSDAYSYLTSFKANSQIPPFSKDHGYDRPEYWMNPDNALTINRFEIEQDNLKVTGTATFHLDKNKQPAGHLTIRIYDTAACLATLKEHKLLNDKQAKQAAFVLRTFKVQNTETQKDDAVFKLSVMNRKLFAGPIPLASIPEIQWPSYNDPDQHQ